MTDGRIPGKWVSEPRFAEMPDATFGFLARAIAWSNEAGTDGYVKRRYLANLHSSGEQQPQVYAALEAAGLWKPTPDGYQFVDWNKKAHHGGLGQELAENVRAYKERKKTNQQRYRDKVASPPVTGHVTGSVTDHVGQEQEQEQEQEQDRLITGEVTEKRKDADNSEEFAPCCGEAHGPMEPCPLDQFRESAKKVAAVKPDFGYCPPPCGRSFTAAGVCPKEHKKERAA